MDFAYPQYLYLLFLIPIIAGLYWWSRLSARKKLKKFGNPETLSSLMPDKSKYLPPIRLILTVLAVASIIIAIARPRYGDLEKDDSKNGIEIMIAFDVSQSMLASSTDVKDGISRLDRAKYILNQLIDKLSNDRVGLIVYAGKSYMQLPLTNDFSIAKIYLNEVSTNMVATQGTDIGAAIRMALNSFTPDTDMKKAIVLITDSEDNEEGAVEAARQAAESEVQVDVIGIGTTTPMAIPIDPANGRFLTDYNNNTVMTALNEATAQQIAEAGKGVFIRGSESDAVEKLADVLDKIEKTKFGQIKYKSSAEQFPWFAWIALVLILINASLSDTKIGVLRNINFFTKK